MKCGHLTTKGTECQINLKDGICWTHGKRSEGSPGRKSPSPRKTPKRKSPAPRKTPKRKSPVPRKTPKRTPPKRVLPKRAPPIRDNLAVFQKKKSPVKKIRLLIGRHQDQPLEISIPLFEIDSKKIWKANGWTFELKKEPFLSLTGSNPENHFEFDYEKNRYVWGSEEDLKSYPSKLDPKNLKELLSL